jgi:uncharacterized protein YqcC (DUF446 family)
LGDDVDYSEHSKKLAEIEAELRRLGFLVGDVTVARPVTSAFGLEDMPFEHWLAYVFLPRAREAIAARSLPASSSVGTMALRNFDGYSDADKLVRLLCEFDALI